MASSKRGENHKHTQAATALSVMLGSSSTDTEPFVKGIFSFHPVKIEFFDEIVQPLVAGRKVNPQAYLNDALRLRSYASSQNPSEVKQLSFLNCTSK